MSLLSHQSAINATQNFWAPAGSGGGGGGNSNVIHPGIGDLAISSITLLPQISTFNNIQAYYGLNFPLNATVDSSASLLILQTQGAPNPNPGDWIQVNLANSNSGILGVAAVPNNFVTANIEQIQPGDITTKVFFYNGGSNGIPYIQSGAGNSGWSKLSQMYFWTGLAPTSYTSNNTPFTFPLLTGASQISTPYSFFGLPKALNQLSARGRITFTSGEPHPNDLLSMQIGSVSPSTELNASYYVPYTTLMNLPGTSTITWSVNGFFNGSFQGNKYSQIFTQVSTFSTASYSCIVDSFIMAQT